MTKIRIKSSELVPGDIMFSNDFHTPSVCILIIAVQPTEHTESWWPRDQQNAVITYCATYGISTGWCPRETDTVVVYRTTDRAENA